MPIPFPNPHDFPLDRPFLVRMDIGGAQSYVPVYVLFPHERSIQGKKPEPAILVDLNLNSIAALVDGDSRITGWTEMPEDAIVLMQYRCPRRYSNSEISRNILQGRKEKHIEELNKIISDFKKQNRLELVKRYEDKKTLASNEDLSFDPLFTDGTFIGYDPHPNQHTR